MSDQRVVALTDDEIGVVFHPPVHRPDAQCPCGDCVAQRSLRSKLMAAMEHPEGITEWRAFVGDEGESNDYADVRGTREEAVADLAIFTDQAAEDGAPYNRQGIESRQCGPWVEAALSPGDGESDAK